MARSEDIAEHKIRAFLCCRLSSCGPHVTLDRDVAADATGHRRVEILWKGLHVATVIHVTNNLLMASPVEGEVRQIGFRCVTASSLPEVMAQIEQGDVVGVLLDIAAQRVTPAELMESLGTGDRPYVLAFAPHVWTEAIAAAEAAGCDLVLPRSRLAGQLPRVLEQLASQQRGD